MLDKLRKNLETIYRSRQGYGEAEFIEKVTNAFAEAGYGQVTFKGTWGQKYLSGQEWYERFEKEFELIEIPKLTPTVTPSDFVQFAIDGARAAAKRAAGLEKP